MEKESVDLVVTSIPFEELFTYSGKLEDVGNNGSTVDVRRGRFALNMKFFIQAAHRVLKPGCNAVIHIQQLLAYKVQHGYIGRRDFRGAIIDLFMSGGFEYKGEVAIIKNPQQMATALNLHSLQFTTGHSRDSCGLAPAPNDFCLIFQKPGDNPNPVKSICYVEAMKRQEWFEQFAPRDQNGKPVKLHGEYIEYMRRLFDKNLSNHKNRGGWLSPEDWIQWAHGAWTDILQIDILDGWRSARESDEEKHVCLARGSLVLTREGYKPIQDVEIGDEVLTHLGRWRSVIAKEMTGIRPVVNLRAQGVPGVLMTPDHKVWARSSCAEKTRKAVAQAAIPDWLPAEDCVGQYVNQKLPPVEYSDYSMQEWWVVGRWLADGHIDKRNVAHISTGYHKSEKLLSDLGEYAGNPRNNVTAVQVPLKDKTKRIRGVLKKCGHGAAGKHLPPEAYTLSEELSLALLMGYLSGDGHYLASRDRWMATSVSKELLLGISFLVQRVWGSICSIYPGRPAGKAVIDGREVNTKQDWVLNFNVSNWGHGFVAEDGAWKRVQSAEPAGEVETWNLRVEEDESYTAEGLVVKNCPLQLSLIQRFVQLYTNPISIQPDVTVLDPFMGIGSTAYVCLGGSAIDGILPEDHHRNVVGFELKESYFDQCQRNIAKVREDSVKNLSPQKQLAFGE